MSGNRDLAARLVVGLAGPVPTAAEGAWLARWRPAGVILFGRNVKNPCQLRSLCRILHELVPGLEIVTDHEGGPVSALAAAAGRPPAAWGLGLLDDPALTRRVHRATGARLAELGVDRVLAPVADVLVHPRSPVVGVRAFGADPERVGRHVAAAVAGLRDGGVGVCLKHWPGHGGAAVDSHLAAAAIGAGAQAAPFVAGVAAGADAVMLGHLGDGETGVPATLDPGAAAAARSLGDPVLRLYADDVAMGALRDPLAARGVAVPPGTGLVDPADLPLAWFAALAAGGCDYLPVWGIPWAAFPAAAAGDPPPAPATDDPEPVPRDDPAWTETWSRLGACLPEEFTASGGRLLRVDRTGGDRWGPADSRGGGMVPDSLPGEVGEALPGSCDRLLVVSHRPLGVAAAGDTDWPGLLRSAGTALAVGHPALEDDLQALLPPDWTVAYLPEWRLQGP